MGILQRVVSMTKAAANEMLDKMENPVMMLNHYLRDLDEEIAKTEHAVAQQQAQDRMLQSKLSEFSGQVSYYEGKAEQAAIEEREAEARTALEAKLLYLEQAEETARLQQLAKQAVLDLGYRIEALKEEKTRLQGKRAELITRVQQTTATPAGYSNSLHGSSASQGFDRIEQKVMELEAQRELTKGSYNSLNASAYSSDQQLEQRKARVDEELKRLQSKKA
ncbi:PspA/IM30 family protein [Bacillus sp. FJAT-28004]|uniref:PspA/IM30 family protein n=1 Tax=Bacillus sp. FJAT-28004 TaxID=1679165 RepID=UPI0006B503AA|nr:PspA/IM30 family protein [Bacillus sp. FJAT-28004]